MRGKALVKYYLLGSWELAFLQSNEARDLLHDILFDLLQDRLRI